MTGQTKGPRRADGQRTRRLTSCAGATPRGPHPAQEAWLSLQKREAHGVTIKRTGCGEPREVTLASVVGLDDHSLTEADCPAPKGRPGS